MDNQRSLKEINDSMREHRSCMVIHGQYCKRSWGNLYRWILIDGKAAHILSGNFSSRLYYKKGNRVRLSEGQIDPRGVF